jgi:hypothetical protein
VDWPRESAASNKALLVRLLDPGGRTVTLKVWSGFPAGAIGVIARVGGRAFRGCVRSEITEIARDGESRALF